MRYRLSKTFPGIDLELFDGWIQDRYTEIMDELPWKRAEGTAVIQVPQSVAANLTAAQGSANITGDGTQTWTTAMNGRMLRINNSSETYLFTQVTANTGTLDRPFEDINGTFAYRIDQAVFQLPANCRELREVTALHQGGYPLNVIAAAKLDRTVPGRNWYDNPRVAAYSWDTQTDPPIQQVELFPVPQCPDSAGNILSFSVDYIFDPAALNPQSTNSNFLPWARPGCLMAGVSYDASLHKGDIAKAQMFGGEDGRGGSFGALLTQMKRIDGRQRGPQKIRISSDFSGRKRGIHEDDWITADGVPGFFHEGYPG